MLVYHNTIDRVSSPCTRKEKPCRSFLVVKGLVGQTDITTMSLISLSESSRGVNDKLVEKLAAGYQLLDVRTAGEHTSNTAKTALNIPLAELNKRVDELDK